MNVLHCRWSSWSSWTCTVTCGGGTYQRLRTCKTSSCHGDGVHASDVECNEHSCPPPTFAPSVIKYVEARIRDTTANTEFKEGDLAVLECDKNGLQLIRHTFPDAKVRWKKNLQLLKEEGDTIDISPISLVDSGVYLCETEYRPKMVQPVKVISVTVVSDEPLHVIVRGNDLTVNCNGAQLGVLFRDLHQIWLVNDKIIKDYGVASPEQVDVDTFYDVPLAWAGEWKCVITEPFTSRSWTTNRFKVQVDPAPQVWKKFVGDLQTILCTVFVGLTIVIVIFCAYFLQRRKRKKLTKTAAIDESGQYEMLNEEDEISD